MKMRRAGCWVLRGWVTLGVGLIALPAHAQEIPDRVEISIGPVWAGGMPFGAVAASEKSATDTPFSLFTTRSRFEGAAGVEGSAAVRVNRWLQAEAIVSYRRPQITTRVTGDFEHAADIDIVERIFALSVQGAFVANLTRWRVGSGGMPFVVAGGGYLRELHEGQTIVRGGHAYFAGAGFRYTLSEKAWILRAFGVKADLRAIVRTGGVALDERAHLLPAASVSAFLGF